MAVPFSFIVLVRPCFPNLVGVSSAREFVISNIGPLAGRSPKRFAGIVSYRRHRKDRVKPIPLTDLLFNRCAITHRPYFLFYLLVLHLFLSTPLIIPIHSVTQFFALVSSNVA
ncbi:unnamed protein product [Protopolystoma xenopodis]|uniref:Uncharacterized protein n=1 Tax=Protopolystoma xenopodis TaxID=117903 RepID=A0A3S5FBY8_9PLAT|nr:unnamed protein product [Protopolystoma xenopodis]